MKIENRFYTAKDLKRIMGLTPQEIYLWLQTYHIFEPAERARGVRGKNKYSLLDLVKLVLIADLQTLGIHLTYLRGIFAELDKPEHGMNLWQRIINERDRIERDGLTLIISRRENTPIKRGIQGITATQERWRDPHFEVKRLSHAEAAKDLKMGVKLPWPILVFDIKMMLNIVEIHAEAKLGQPQGKKMTGA